MQYPTWAAGQRVTAAGLASMTPPVAYKSADQTIASSTTNVNDNHLFQSCAANAIFVVTGFLLYSAHQDADIKMGWTGPSGATFAWIAHASTQSQTGGIASSGIVVDRQNIGASSFPLGGYGAENTTVMTATLMGTLVTSSTAGALQLTWAQRVSNATGSIMRTGSWLRLERIS
ncbi:hypothetical protein ACFWNQ_25160 [Streptomyces virginiae]|uniref:hypothetical protein n=1 Tax=Streptomyces virginiae TaxID=1961 RepID=UPI00364C17EE